MVGGVGDELRHQVGVQQLDGAASSAGPSQPQEGDPRTQDPRRPVSFRAWAESGAGMGQGPGSVHCCHQKTRLGIFLLAQSAGTRRTEDRGWPGSLGPTAGPVRSQWQAGSSDQAHQASRSPACLSLSWALEPRREGPHNGHPWPAAHGGLLRSGAWCPRPVLASASSPLSLSVLTQTPPFSCPGEKVAEAGKCGGGGADFLCLETDLFLENSPFEENTSGF